jgi:hypothetical protein
VPPPPPAGAARVVVTPLATLGNEVASALTKQVEAQLALGVAAVPDMGVIPAAELARVLRDAKELRACDGRVDCLADLGKLLAARYVIAGEAGGLGEAQVVFLKVVDVDARRELRSTTLELGGAREPAAEARAAAYRLLAPGRYRGVMALAIDVAGASIFVDGERVASSPSKPLAVAVGTHALRVTHPKYRDYVRFVDVDFEQTVELTVGLQEFPIIAKDMREEGRRVAAPIGAPGPIEPRPWYREWYAVAGFGAIVLVGSAVAIGFAVDGIEFDHEQGVDGQP